MCARGAEPVFLDWNSEMPFTKPYFLSNLKSQEILQQLIFFPYCSGEYRWVFYKEAILTRLDDDNIDVAWPAISAFEVSDFVVHWSACFACKYLLTLLTWITSRQEYICKLFFLEIVLLRSQTFNWGEHIGVVRLHSFIYFLEVLLEWKRFIIIIWGFMVIFLSATFWGNCLTYFL